MTGITASKLAVAAPRRRTRSRSAASADHAGGAMSRTVSMAVILVAVVYMVFPLVWLVISSTKTPGDLYSTNGFAFGGTFALFDNIGQVLTTGNGQFVRWFGNTVLYAGVGALVSTFISVLAGFAFDKYSFAGKGPLFGLVLVGVLVPATVMALPMYLLATQLGLVNTIWAVLIPSFVNPFGVYLARVFSQGYVPNELLEAARMDGAGEFRAFWSVGLRLIAPGAVTIFLFSFTASWNSFVLPLLMLTDTHLFPLGVGLYMWNAQIVGNPQLYSQVIVGSLLAVIPLIIAFVALQRFWRNGMTAGALK